jgi:hypothetical protein
MNYAVKLFWDDEARVWYSICEDLHIFLEAATIHDLVRMNNESAAELLEFEGKSGNSYSLSFVEPSVLATIAS